MILDCRESGRLHGFALVFYREFKPRMDIDRYTVFSLKVDS